LNFSQKRQDGSVPNFFSGCRKSQSALKSTAPGL